jgi:hypothetical protein
LIETWKNNDSDIQISGYKNYHICRTKKNKAKKIVADLLFILRNI